jgi:hypothetical protein
MTPLTRTKGKPPANALCDAHVTAVRSYTGHAPTVVPCKNPATREYTGGGMTFETWLCQWCGDKIEAKQETKA